MDKALARLGACGIVPVVVLEDAQNALPAADALFSGGIDVMEITLRTKAGLESIRAVAKNRPAMFVGAGTVLTLDQCKSCVDSGAGFIVLPGFSLPVVKWCVEHGVAVTPGCVTPTEIMTAVENGCTVLKFFPAGVYGGLSALKALAGPFGNVTFIPTGGVDSKNIGEFALSPFVHAVGGSWVCAKDDIKAGNFGRITDLSKEAVRNFLGFEFAHVGVNARNEDESMKIADLFAGLFGFEKKPGASSVFAGNSIEVMKSVYLGEKGHIAVRTNRIDAAVKRLEAGGFAVDPQTAKYRGDKTIAVYLKADFGGFAVHLLQK
ncbi:MAG: bifunctional 4-hydroxy-2-oxoglutarate aldolase/2-dehydro-3-deoxy-phosphogluconate aldolase [Treponema sp.]|jgi:2-dehydro-3-deoxyphosphogluconate aldolase/(4S)-4-hydroxy-2-oxoglutarate aldolase|nr:bifunctional 4-hydroxy-2-oxoglutarate aldolase/2-dehydro-3-deoxy-phosphogluconate aldolase [Treponema sp.]